MHREILRRAKAAQRSFVLPRLKALRTVPNYLSRRQYLKRINQFYHLSSAEYILVKETLEKHNICNCVLLADTPALLKNLGLSKEDTFQNLEVFTLQIRDIYMRVNYFKESGGTINSQILTRFHQVINKSILALKAADIFPEKCNVTETIFSSIGLKMPDQNLPGDPFSSLREVHWSVTLYYLNYLFDGAIQRKAQTKISKFVSVTDVKNVAHFLFNDVNVPTGWIINHMGVLNSSSNILSRMLLFEKYPYKLNILDLIKQNPLVITYNLDNMLQLLTIFESFSIPEHEVMKHSHLLKEDPQILIEELVALARQGVLDINLLGCLTEKEKQHSGKSNAKSAHYRRRRGANSLPQFLANLLKTDVESIANALGKHPFWTRANPSSSYETLDLLKSYGYSNGDIKACLVLLLYPRSVVQRTLECFVRGKESLQHANRERDLQLCLYYIEVQNKFSWNINCDAVADLTNDDFTNQVVSKELNDDMANKSVSILLQEHAFHYK